MVTAPDNLAAPRTGGGGPAVWRARAPTATEIPELPDIGQQVASHDGGEPGQGRRGADAPPEEVSAVDQHDAGTGHRGGDLGSVPVAEGIRLARQHHELG